MRPDEKLLAEINANFRAGGPAAFYRDHAGRTPHEEAISGGQNEPSGWVENSVNTVRIDESGITIVDGSIRVSNAEGTIVIDGSSNMLKIIAQGSISGTKTSGSDGTVASASLAGLGNFNYVPAHISYIATGVGAANPRVLGPGLLRTQLFAASSSGGSPTTAFLGVLAYSRAEVTMSAIPGTINYDLKIDNHSGADVTRHSRFFILQEIGT